VLSRKLKWQSIVVLVAVLEVTSVTAFFQALEWMGNYPEVVVWCFALSGALGIVAWRMRSATGAAALMGSLITVNVMLSTVNSPRDLVRTGLLPILAVVLATSWATRFRRERKGRLKTAEDPRGRSAMQVAANLGMAAIAAEPAVQAWMMKHYGHGSSIDTRISTTSTIFLSVALAALAEAAADTVSSEVGQALGGQPRMLTTGKSVEPGTDGAVSLAGTGAGALAAFLVAAVGTIALHGGWQMAAIACAGGVFGLFFDSLLGATLERWGWLNNDAVNFLSTASAAGFALLLLAHSSTVS